MLHGVSLAIVVGLGLYFVVLGAMSFVAPARVASFLFGFASSAGAHYLELAIRIAAGMALIDRAPTMLYAQAFSMFGWVLVITSICLALVPWKWHRQFARTSVSSAVKHLKFIGIASLGIGGVTLAAVVHGNSI